ncbi:hypothetical protein Ndes2437A_g07300 [Nannochloris sp. 'desiccata']
MRSEKHNLIYAIFAFFVVSFGTFQLVQLMMYYKNGIPTLLSTGPSNKIKISTAPLDAALQLVFTTRVCGSPAVDGYVHVKRQCLRESPTAQWWYNAKPDPYKDLVTHIEQRADYDGLAVGWGIDNKKATVEECAEACRAHKMNPNDQVGFGALPCNAFAYCDADICFEPDAHKHSRGGLLAEIFRSGSVAGS